jgi:hypothetical protein
MAGPGRRRLRAASTSTVATVDERAITFLQENQVVRPPPPGTAPDDLPCFELTEAAVYDRHGQMANLLQVDLEGPFLVRGLLNIEPDQAEYCKPNEPNPRPMLRTVPTQPSPHSGQRSVQVPFSMARGFEVLLVFLRPEA